MVILANVEHPINFMHILALVIKNFGTIIFPYLGGQWTGSIEFQGSHGCGTRDVSLRIDHTLFTIKLILESEESTSRTLSVCAYRDSGISRDRLYYVFQNERKEGISNEEDILPFVNSCCGLLSPHL